MPSRLHGASPAAYIAWVLLIAVIVVSLDDVASSFEQLVEGVPSMASLLDRMIPPNIESGFLTRVFWQIIETFQIALVGTAIGIVLSLPIAWLASREHLAAGAVFVSG